MVAAIEPMRMSGVMAHFVGHHPRQLLAGEDVENPLGGGDHRVLRVAPGGEGVGGRLRQHIDARHRQLVALADLGDHLEERAAGHLLAAVHFDDDLVGEPVGAEIHHRSQDQGDQGAARPADRAADRDQPQGQHGQQEEGAQGIHRSTPQ